MATTKRTSRQIEASAEKLIAALEFIGVDMNGRRTSAVGVTFQHLKSEMERGVPDET